MKRLLSLATAAVFLLGPVQAQQLVAAEYFFDTDPGVGAATPLSVTTGDSVVYTGNISSGALPKGFHFLNIRVKDSNGTWSLSERRLFLVQAVTVAPALAAAEYFFDTDPGIGNGTSLAVTGGDSIVFAGTVPSTGLTDGFHFLSIRTKDASGSWSVAERRMFYVRTVTTAGPVNQAEYFFDNDPGTGNGTSLPVTGGDSIVFAGLVPSGALTAGFHFLSIRASGSDNKWSLIERRMFYIQDPAPSAPLVAVEYFVNVDTGFGNCADIPVASGDSIDFLGLLALSDTSQGFYTLFIRALDSLNRWSLNESRTFMISNSTAVQVAGTGQTVLFQNFPNPFKEASTIEYYLHLPGDVTLTISDALGKIVLEIRNDNRSRGKHAIQLTNRYLAEGFYTYRLTSGNFTDTKRMLVTR